MNHVVELDTLSFLYLIKSFIRSPLWYRICLSRMKLVTQIRENLEMLVRKADSTADCLRPKSRLLKLFCTSESRLIHSVFCDNFLRDSHIWNAPLYVHQETAHLSTSMLSSNDNTVDR